MGGEKLINKKEKALKAREEELRRNLQELGEDVAAITGHAPAKEVEPPTPAAPAASAESTTSPQQRKKRGGKVEKQLKIKLWGKGLRSKENAEPLRKEDTTEGEEDAVTTAVVPSGKISPARKVPDDISHLFTPHSVATSKGVTRSSGRGQKAAASSATGATAAVTSGAGQQLELITGKRFISIGSSPESVRKSPANHLTDETSGKRSLASPGPKQSPKRMKLGLTPLQPTPVPFPHKAKTAEGFGFFPSEHFNNFVSYAYHGLLHVFRYLTVQELMAAAGVCKLWRDLALHHSHVY